MQVRFRLVAVVTALTVMGMAAGTSLASHYVEGGLAPATTTQAAGGTPAASSGESGQSGDSGSNAADPESSAKKGKGYCIGDNDGDTIKCPSHKKAAKKGKGWDVG